MIDHVYAGARVQHNSLLNPSNLWYKDYNTWYKNLWDTYNSKIVLEIGSHDHWEDLRVWNNPGGGKPERNLLVTTAISP